MFLYKPVFYWHLSDLSVAVDDVFIGGHFGKTHRASGVHFLGGDSDLCAKAEFLAVGETGGGVDVNRRRINCVAEKGCIFGVFGDDRFAVSRAVDIYMGDCFFHIFNHLHQTGKQLIMCCDREPSKLDGMEDRLLSRFKWGLVVEVEKPDFNLRKAILKHKTYKDGIIIPEDVIDYIAENVTSSVRDLEGVLISLLAHSTLMNAEINIQLAQKIVGNVVETPTIEKEDITVDKICNIVCQYYSLPLEAINSKSRERKIAEARQVAMYLARTYTNTSLSVIGQSMGKRDHTTVLYACKTVQNQMDVDATFKARIHTLESQIQQK